MRGLGGWCWRLQFEEESSDGKGVGWTCDMVGRGGVDGWYLAAIRCRGRE